VIVALVAAIVLHDCPTYQGHDEVRADIRAAHDHEAIPLTHAAEDAMVEIAWRESRFDPTAQNPRSTAFGRWQFLDATWEHYGVQKTEDAQLQTIAAVRYVYEAWRHGSPEAALAHHDEKGWY
jgi:hypothetical protein